MDAATSNSRGELAFARLPAGPILLRPQLERDEECDPPQYEVTIPAPAFNRARPVFTVTRPNATVRLSSNRENTLVAITRGLPAERPPDVSLREPVDNGVYGRIVSDPSTLSIPPGLYSLRCWWTDSGGRLQTTDPPGGLNTSISAGESYAFECRFNP